MIATGHSGTQRAAASRVQSLADSSRGLLIVLASLTGLACAASHAAPHVSYDPSRNCVVVVGYPEEAPATMDTIQQADQRHGWGKVTYDRAADTYTVATALWIGDDRARGTFVQIGDAAHPRVTVVVKGSVWVRPPRESPRRSDGLLSVINRLTLGDPHDDRIRATLKIACDTPGQHGVYVGFRSHDSKTIVHRGALRVYNSTITAATQDRQHAWGGRDYTDEHASPRWSRGGWYASEVRLINATVSWFEGCAVYGIHTGKLGSRERVQAMQPDALNVIGGTTFEHGGAAVRNGSHFLPNCTFRDLDIAVAEGGCLTAKLVDCTFEGNRLNWTLGSVMSGGIVMLDCNVGPQQGPITLKKNRLRPDEAARRNLDVYPSCLVRQSLRVRVVDAAGQPVPGAMIAVSCQADPQQVTRGAMVTDEAGLTPDAGDAGVSVLTLQRRQATDDPDRPSETAYAYEVTVQASGYRSKTVPLPPGRALPKPLMVSMAR